MPIDSRQYDSAVDFTSDPNKFAKILNNIVSDDDKSRIKAYLIYEDMYHNRPEHIRVTIRGDDEDDSVQIYIPSAKKCIEAVNRFLGVGWKIAPDSSLELDEKSTQSVSVFMDKLFKRERLKSKFAQLKRYSLIKGDALLHITADPRKPTGRKISIEELKPEHYFPIEDADGDLIGCHIIDIIKNPRNNIKLKYFKSEDLVRRQTYRRKINEKDGTSRITSELGLYEIAKWDDRVLEKKDISLVQEIRAEYYLPEQITNLPVYHWKNNPPPGSSFGMSELAGVESLVNAINQSMSDEDLTLIMQGLGVYWTDAAPPLNSAGEEVEWEISPRAVVQVASGGNFNRVSGVSSVQPFGDHVKALDEAMQQAIGVPDIAIGTIDDSSIAESGIALQLKLGPLIAKNKEKEIDLLDTSDQFIYDLITGWFVAYEKIDTAGTNFINHFDDAMPRNKAKELQDLLSLWGQTSSILPVAWFYQQLNDIMGSDITYPEAFDAALNDAIKIVDASRGTPEPAPEEVPAESDKE